MTNSRAIDALFYSWLIFTLLLALTIIVQSLAGKYGGDWAVPSQWAFSMVAPCLTVVTVTWRNKGKAKWQDARVAMPHFLLAYLMSVLVWLGTVAIFVFEAMGPLRIYEILPVTVVMFTLIQVTVITAVSKIAFANR